MAELHIEERLSDHDDPARIGHWGFDFGMGQGFPQIARIVKDWQDRSEPTHPIDRNGVKWPEREVLVELEQWPGIFVNRLDRELIDSLLPKRVRT